MEPPGGAWLVRLDGVDPAASIPRVVAETLHVSGGEEMLAERFAGAESLLLLDNCEHVVEPVVSLVARLLDAAPGLTVLATSQVPLGLDGEVVHGLEPLGLADSTALFAGRATQHRHQFVLDEDNAGAVEDLCRALDGLPLAIELAAARVKSLSVQEIARRLDDRFSLLRDPTSRAPERRRGLAGAIGWSYDLLFPDDQRGLWALSVFTGGAPLAAAEHVLGALDVPAESAVDVVGRLADRSLVSVEVDGGRRGPLPAARQHPCLRAGAVGRGGSGGRGVGRARRLVRGRRRPVCRRGARARTARLPGRRAGGAGQHRRGPGVVRRPGSPARRAARDRLRLDLGRARRRRGGRGAGPRRGRRRPVHSRRPVRRPRRCCSPAGSRPRPATWSRRSGTSTGSLVLADAARRRARAARTRRGTSPSCGSSRAARRTCSPRPAPASSSTGERGFTWEVAAGLRARVVRLDHAGRHRRRDRGSGGGRRPADADRRLVGDGARAGHARRDRAGRAPVRRGRRSTWPAPRRSPSGSGSWARPRCT